MSPHPNPDLIIIHFMGVKSKGRSWPMEPGIPYLSRLGIKHRYDLLNLDRKALP